MTTTPQAVPLRAELTNLGIDESHIDGLMDQIEDLAQYTHTHAPLAPPSHAQRLALITEELSHRASRVALDEALTAVLAFASGAGASYVALTREDDEDEESFAAAVPLFYDKNFEILEDLSNSFPERDPRLEQWAWSSRTYSLVSTLEHRADLHAQKVTDKVFVFAC